MKRNNFTELLKHLVKDFYKDDGSIVIEDSQSFAGYSLRTCSKKVFKELLELVMNTEYFPDEVKKYLQGTSIERIATEQKEKIPTVKSRIHYRLGNLKRELGKNALKEILINPNEIVVSLYGEKIHELYETYSNRSLLEHMAINITTIKQDETVDFLSENELKVLFQVIKFGSIAGQRRLSKCLTKNMIAYVYYIEAQKKQKLLTKKEMEIYEKLRSYINGGL